MRFSRSGASRSLWSLASAMPTFPGHILPAHLTQHLGFHSLRIQLRTKHLFMLPSTSRLLGCTSSYIHDILSLTAGPYLMYHLSFNIISFPQTRILLHASSVHPRRRFLTKSQRFLVIWDCETGSDFLLIDPVGLTGRN
ncbi:hypothetical protein MSAN_01610400 [Mycena sanguinolenta]|uniref:Uncharacterized protein n=1 Tax=Mycena sanguinolenta TaxID=230812 RepID=A0A8H6Y4Z0_9AGAR|nr:hypothetical protein MSAN_01610400 [Mycena sanguinolenta]